MHPITYSEQLPIATTDYTNFVNFPLNIKPDKSLLDLMQLGGFPEPFFSGSLKESKRWRAGYSSRIVRDDIRDLEKLNYLAKVELLLSRLPDTVGSVLSINSLREDLEVSHPTLKI